MTYKILNRFCPGSTWDKYKLTNKNMFNAHFIPWLDTPMLKKWNTFVTKQLLIA